MWVAVQLTNLSIVVYFVCAGIYFEAFMVKDDSASGRVNIVLNWFEEQKRLVPTK